MTIPRREAVEPALSRAPSAHDITATGVSPAPEPSGAGAPAGGPPPEVDAAHPWRRFEELGLAPRPSMKLAQRLLVSSYRLLGLGILSLIVLVLLGYIATTAFYFVDRSWVTPVTISPHDEKVLALQSQLAVQRDDRARLAAELQQTERAIAAEAAFQLQFTRAIRNDRDGRQRALRKIRRLAYAAEATRDEIRATNGDYAASTVRQMSDEYVAGLIDRQAMLAGTFELAQITNASLSLAERQTELDLRADALAVEARSLDAILGDRTATAALSYDVLEIARDAETSRLALARHRDDRARLQASIASADTILRRLEQSAYLRAIDTGTVVALIPYANLKDVVPGTPLYACRLEMILCRRVGTVQDLLPGEVTIKHPARDRVLRGRMIVMELAEARAAEEAVLFAGGAPLGF